MSDSLPVRTGAPPSEAERERAVARLSDAFAHDVIPLEELERRLTEAYRAPTASALAELVADLPAAEPDRSARVPATTPLLAAPRTLTAFFGSIERGGAMQVPERLDLRARFGSVELDLSDATFAPGVTEIAVDALFGSVELWLPADVRVECDGAGVFGSFECEARGGGAAADRVVRITGRALLASVEVKGELRIGGDGRRLHS